MICLPPKTSIIWLSKHLTTSVHKWTIFQERVVRNKLNIYVFINFYNYLRSFYFLSSVNRITLYTSAVSSNPAHCEVYSIQQYVIKFVIDLRQVGGFLRALRFPPPIKTDRHDISEILLKVASNNHNPGELRPWHSMLVLKTIL